MDLKSLEDLARRWILTWNDGDPHDLPLAPNFEHRSPGGLIVGRDPFLNAAIPASKQNVARLTVEDVVAQGDRAVVRYVRETPDGSAVPSCDWVSVKDGQLTHVWAYYDTQA